MAQNYISIQNLKFLLFEVHKIDTLFTNPYYSEYDQESVEMMIDSAKDFADKELFPFFSEMDRLGVQFEDGKVTVHPQVYRVLNELGKSGWLNATQSFEAGGIQLPYIVAYMIETIYTAANNSAIGYSLLTAGAARLILTFGSEELKSNYASKMCEGRWQGTMALTEPEAGSSLSDITTKATRNEDGSFNISGQKIFISGGDYEAAENIVHLMLARIEGAPSGAKGISLFIVPKRRLTADRLESNDVTTAGLFHKMGQNGYVTTHLIMGEKGDCIGYLVGEENNGLKYMFQMMNTARIEVGLTGAAIASAAYYASLEYSKERSQGRKPDSKHVNQDPMPIIEHADVRRMLFAQKAMVEGSLSLLTQCALYEDLLKTTEGEEKVNYHLLLELLTPIVKTYPTEKGIESVSNGLQCLGGYGYCVDFPLEQLYRDIRITSIYEGTTGIQSLDLLGRKMIMQDGKAAKLLLNEINETLRVVKNYPNFESNTQRYQDILDEYQQVLKHLITKSTSGKVEEFLSDANLFMELSGLLVMGWQWLKQAVIAYNAIQMGSDTKFYESKIHTMKYYFAYELPKCSGLMTRLIDSEVLTIKGDKEYLL
ncbi:MAG: acyl-CoA dehydrogenase [Cyclobacteriaceae bacterium]|jgi:alkylation response protein AidB-like acyl-CoA dehydrogenase|nr:acyl-CoA dehydrogenase [Cyclobacteriaceae bacterium]